MESKSTKSRRNVKTRSGLLASPNVLPLPHPFFLQYLHSFQRLFYCEWFSFYWSCFVSCAPNTCIWWMHVFHILRNKSVKDFNSPSLLDPFYASQSLISSFNRLNCQPLHAFVKELSISTLIIWLTPQTIVALLKYVNAIFDIFLLWFGSP